MSEVGFLIHFIAPLTLCVSDRGIGDGRSFDYGDELLVTDELRKMNTSNDGRCVLDLIDDPVAQEARFRGKVVFVRGPWPEGRSRIEPNSARFEELREDARQAAHAIKDPVQRDAALRKVNEQFGPMRTSRTTAVYQ
jgi:hypothetical protein